MELKISYKKKNYENKEIIYKFRCICDYERT